MKIAKTFKRVCSLTLTLALLVGMVSVMGAFPMTASAETENTSANKFVADFSELGALLEDATMKDSADNTHYETAYTPVGDTESLDGKINTWMRERFASTTNYKYSSTRAWFAQKSDEISDAEADGWGKNGKLTGFALTPSGNLRLRVINASGANMMRRVDTIIPQFSGENVKLKNFKMTIKYRTYLQANRGAIMVGLDETKAGYIPAEPNVYSELGYRRKVTGSMLVLGNGTGMEQPAGNDGWIFYNKKSLISSTTVDEKHYADAAIAWRELKPGSDYTMEKGEVVYERFETESTQQLYTLTVEVKNGKATFTTISEDGTRNETMEMAYTPNGGYVSIGMSNRDYVISYVDIEEYDENGNAVDFGTYHNSLKGVDKAVEIFEADFTDLPDVNYVENQYLYNANHDTSTGKGVGLTATDTTNVTSVGAYASKYTVNVKDKALVGYLESKFDFYTYANGGGGTFPMWNAAGYVVDADGNPLGSGFNASNPHDPATGVASGAYMPGSGLGGYWYSGMYPTMTLSENKWFHIASDIGINAMNPFDVVYSYALNDANGDKAVVKNFQLDLDFKLTHPGYGSYAHNQSPLFVKFGGYDSVTSGCTDGAMFAISHNGGYFLDDLSTGFTGSKSSDNSPAYTEYIGGAAATQKVGEAHLTLTVKNGTVNAVVTLADGTKVLDVTKNDISIQSGLIYIGTSYAGMNHGLPYFGAVKVVRLDNNGNPIDFTDGDEGSFDASFVGVTDVVGGKYYRNLGTKDTAILTGKSTPWLSNAVAIADVGDKGNDGYAFGAEDTNIVNYLNEKFDFYHAAPNSTLTKMATPYQNADEIYADASYGGGQWKLAGGRWLRATFDNGVYWADAFRKQMILVPKMNGEAIKSKDLSIEFDMAHGRVNNGNSYSAALIMLRSAEVAKTSGAAGAYTDAIAVRITHKGISVYDGTAPANTHGHTNDDQFLYGGDIYNTHVYLDLNGDQLYLKVTSLDGATTYAEQTVTVANCMNAGYAYMSVCNSDIAFADIEITPVALDPAEAEWIEGLPTYVGGYNTIVAGRNGAQTFVIEGTNANRFNSYRASVESAGWTKVSDNEAASNLFATYQKDGQTVYMYYLAAESRVHVVKMEANAVLPSAAADYNKVCDPLFTQVQLSYATASEGMSYLVRLSDGRFIVIDGGDDEPDYLESKHLYSLMAEQNVLDKITVAAWIITHAHGDHQLVPTEFMNYYTAEDLTIEQVVFNYPIATPNAAQTDAFLAAVDAWSASGTKRVTPYIGQEFNFADAKIEFLHTIDAYAPGQIDGEDFNNTSSVFSIEIAGQKIMILGDMHTIGNDQLVKLYGDYLKSDIVQFNHHGVGGGTRELYVEIDPSVVMNPAGVFHHTNTYNYYRYHAPATDRTKQAFQWLYNNESGHVKEVFTMGFKEVTLTLPYTSPKNCEYMANRNNNGYVFEEAVQSDATVPNPFFELDLGGAANTVYYKDAAYSVPSKRVESGAAVETYTVDGLADVLSGNNSFELFVAIDGLPNVLSGEVFGMFGTSTNGLNLIGNTLNVNLARGANSALTLNGGRYYRGNVVGGNVVNHIVGTYNAETGVLSIYENGVLIQSGTYAEGFTAENVLNLGSTNFNKLGYTVLGARIYDAALTDEQVASAYWNAVDDLQNGNLVKIDETENTVTIKGNDGYELKAGSLIAKDSDGNAYVPTRVGFRNGGDASKYSITDGSTIASFEFIRPTLDNPNIGMVGTSFNKEQCGLRFIGRFTRQVIDGVEYVVMADGNRYAISDYGMLVASEAGLETTEADTAEDMTLHTANAYVKPLSAKKLSKYYDICDDHLDISACIINLDKVADFEAIKNMKMYARAYVVISVNGDDYVLYSDIADMCYYDGIDAVTVTKSVSELRAENHLLINGRHLIADETTNKGFVNPGDIVVDFGNAGITIAGDLAGDIYVDVAYNMYTYGECRINVMVDGAYVDDVVVKYGVTRVKVVSGLENGYHTIKIAKGVGTPSFGDLVFKNVTYSGYLTTPVANDFQIEFLGDSITDTVGILSSDYANSPDIAGQTNPTENVRLGYSALTAQALGADFTLVSMSGNTISMTSDLFKETTWKYQGQDMPYTFGSGDTTEKDVVVINLGTNGLWGATADNIEERRPGLQADVKECLTAVRAKYPNAYIVWTYGMLCYNYEDVLSDAVAEWASETGDTKASYCSLTAAANQDGAGRHPLAVGHENAAKILTQYIADLLDMNETQNVTLASDRPLKVACVGDSITALGYWENNLQGYLPTEFFEVKGFGKSGSTASLKGTDGEGATPKAYMNQTQHTDSLAYGADIVVLMLGTNDSKPENWPRCKNAFVYDYVKLVRAYQNVANTPYVYIMAPLTAYDNIFSGINDETIVNDIIPALQKVAKITGAKFVMDTHTVTSGNNSWTDDGVHPSEAGKALVASTIADIIKEDALGVSTTSLAELREAGAVLINGRHTITDEGNVKVSFGNAGITLAGNLEGDIYLDAKYTKYAFGECRINVMVDGEYVKDAVAVYGDNYLKVVEGLKAGYHTVTISKGVGTPSLGDLVFKNVAYNGQLETPAVNDLQFMFLGDSITDTAGILGLYNEDAPDQAGKQLPSQNIRLGYAAQTSKALGADFTQVSFAGLTTSQVQCLFNEEAFPQGGAMSPYEYGSGDTTDKDVVVINLGTNNIANGLKDEVKACLTAVRAKYQDAYIVWTYGMMFTTHDQALSEAVAEWVAETGDTKTSYCSLTAAANTDGGAMHPLAQYHAQAAEILTAHIANLLNAE